MDDKVKKEILKRFEQLPKDIQNVILSSDFPTKIDVIRQKHQLTEEQGTDLSNEAMFVMIGLEKPSAFIENIRKNLGLTSEKANEIAAEVNDTVFKQIRESLKNIHGPSEPEDVSRSPETILNRRTFTMPQAPTRPSTLSPNALNVPPKVPPMAPPTAQPIVPSPKNPPNAPPNLPTGPASWQTFQKPTTNSTTPGTNTAPQTTAPKSAWNTEWPTKPAPASTPPPIKKPEAQTQSRYVPPQPGSVSAEIVEPSRQDEGIIEQKLRTPTTIPREEKMYVLDPYREPTE